jgi:hypothetical protein
MTHISRDDLEGFHLGIVQEAELAMIEEDLLTCSRCVDAAAEAFHYVDSIRAAIITGNFDLIIAGKRRCN